MCMWHPPGATPLLDPLIHFTQRTGRRASGRAARGAVASASGDERGVAYARAGARPRVCGATRNAWDEAISSSVCRSEGMVVENQREESASEAKQKLLLDGSGITLAHPESS